ncbi:hypothetical protein H1R20_g2458, partial [Candolleomyces eurysporus]
MHINLIDRGSSHDIITKDSGTIIVCTHDTRLGGVIYIHDITQDRGGSQYGRTWPAGQLKHPEPLRHLLLATAKWDLTSESRPAVFEQREHQLKTSVWNNQIRRGVQVERFLNTKDSAWTILSKLLALAPLELSVLQRDLDRILQLGHIREPPRGKGKKKEGLFSFLFNWRQEARSIAFAKSPNKKVKSSRTYTVTSTELETHSGATSNDNSQRGVNTTYEVLQKGVKERETLQGELRSPVSQEDANPKLLIYVADDIQRMPFFKQWSNQKEIYRLRVVPTSEANATISLISLPDCDKIGLKLSGSQEKEQMILHTISPKISNLHQSLQHLCHYYFYRDHFKPTRERGQPLLSSKVTLSMFKLQQVDEDGELVPSGPNLNVGGSTIELTVGSHDGEPKDAYGFRIGNLDHNVYPYLFHFEDSTFSIKRIYSPPIDHGALGDSLSVGYGGESEYTQPFYPSIASDRDEGFLRLYLSREYIDLSFMEQLEISKASREFVSDSVQESFRHLDYITIPVVILKRGEAQTRSTKCLDDTSQDLQSPFRLRATGEVFDSRSDSQQTPVNHRLACFVAVDAHKHLKMYRTDIIRAMGSPDTPMIVLAGFNEGLIAEDMGMFLQEIHIVSSESLTLERHVLDAVAKACSPFPSMVFMPSGKTIRPPVFNADGKSVNFEDLIPPPSASHLHLNTALNKGQTLAGHTSGGHHGNPPSDNPQDGRSGGEPSRRLPTEGHSVPNPQSGMTRRNLGDASQPGEEESHQNRMARIPRNTLSGEDESFPVANSQGAEHTQPPQGPPVPGDGGATQRPYNIRFDIKAVIFQPPPGDGLLQTLQLIGGFNFKVTPGRTSSVDFTKMRCQALSNPNAGYRYSQRHLKVLIDSYSHEWDLLKHKPKSTLASDGQVKQNKSKKIGWQLMSKIAFSFPFKGTAEFGRTTTGEDSTSDESIRFKSRIIQQEDQGVFWWTFHVDDEHAKERGIELGEDHLPSAEMSVSQASGCTPNHSLDKMSVEIASFWSLLGKGNEEWISYGPQDPLPTWYSNICQVVSIDLPPGDAKHGAELHVGPESPTEQMPIILSPTATPPKLAVLTNGGKVNASKRL